MRKIKTLNTQESVEFINGVVENCFKKDEEGNIDYMPHLADAVLRSFVVQMYGGVPFEEGTDIMEFAYGGTYYDVIRSGVVNEEQLNDLTTAIRAQVGWIKEKLLAQSNVKIAESAMALAIKKTPFEGVDAALSAMVDKLGEKFDSVNWSELAEDVHNLKLDPEAFVKELMDKKYPTD